MPHDESVKDALVRPLQDAIKSWDDTQPIVAPVAAVAPVTTAAEKRKLPRGVFVGKDGAHWIQYWGADGKRHREKAGSLSTAKKLVELRRTEKLQGKLPQPRKRAIAFSELTDRALKHAEPEGRGIYHYRMNILKAKFGDMAAEEIKPSEVDQWLEEHAEWSTASRNRYLALMKLVYRLAEYDEKIKVNPLRKVRQKKECNARDRYLNQYEPAETSIEWLKEHTTEETRLRAVIQHDYPEHYNEFVVALETGMRRSEQYGATWERVNFFTGKLHVPKSKHGDARFVKLNSRVKAVLTMMKPSPARGLIFGGKPRHWFEAAVKKAGVTNFTWHCLRHTYCSWLVMNGVDLLTVSKLAGHKGIAMTMRYSHLAPSILDQACEKTEAPCATITATAQKSAEQVTQLTVQ